MPLQAGDLDQHLVVVPPGQTVGQALDELKNRGGDDTWSLFVPWLDGTWGVLEAGELRSFLAELGAALFGRTLGELWERVPEALAVQDSIGISAAEEQALRQPKGALLVLHGQDVAGRFYRGTHRASARPSIGDLYAGYLATPADRRSTWTPKGADPASHEGEETVLPVDMPTSKPAPSAAESYVSTGFG